MKPEILSTIRSLAILGLLLGIAVMYQPWSQGLFYSGFISLVIASIIFVLSSYFIKPNAVESLILAAVMGKIIGISAMFQFWDIQYFQYGFYLLGICTILFIVAAHLPVKEENPT